jgi:hypothetical protein
MKDKLKWHGRIVGQNDQLPEKRRVTVTTPLHCDSLSASRTGEKLEEVYKRWVGFFARREPVTYARRDTAVAPSCSACDYLSKRARRTGNRWRDAGGPMFGLAAGAFAVLAGRPSPPKGIPAGGRGWSV